MTIFKILVHGSDEATDALQKFCKGATNLTDQIFTPKVGEALNVSAARNIFQVKLSDSLISSLQTTRLGDFELAYINGVVHYPSKEVSPSEEKENMQDADGMDQDQPEITEDDSATVIPHLDPVPVQTFHKPVIVGQIKLSDFRKVLQANKLATIFFQVRLQYTSYCLRL